MAKLEELLTENGIVSSEKLMKTAPKSSIGRELINNLMYRIQRRGNVLVEMQGHYVKKVRIELSSNFFAPGEKNFHVMVKPFTRGKYLMLDWNGVIIRASDIFGNGINVVQL